MEDKFKTFFAQYNNQPNVGVNSNDIGQCTGLVMKWVEYLNLPFFYGHAKDLLTNADSEYFLAVQNTPDNVPSIGDIMVWGAQVGERGHTAIYDSGDVNSFISFDQNWPIGSPCHLQGHNYSGVLGWLVPKLTIESPQPTISSMPDYLTGLFKEQNLDPEDEPAVRAFWQKALDFDSCNTDKLSAQTNLATANNQISDLRATNATQASMISDLQAKLASVGLPPTPVPPTPPASTSKSTSGFVYWIERLLGNK